MIRWTTEDTIRSVAVGAAFVVFFSFEGSTLMEKLGLGNRGRATAASASPEEAAHQEALALERRFPMIDVIGYGHGNGQENRMTFVVFGVVDTEAVQAREGEIALALMQLAGRLAEETSEVLLVVHFSLSEGVMTGEFYCPKAEYAVYDDMVNGDCVASVYAPDERGPLPDTLALWHGVGR